MPVLDFAYEIPIIEPALYAGNYTAVPVDMADPRWNEALVRLDSVGVAYDSYHARKDGTNWPYCRPLAGALPDVWLRASVAAMLARVNDRLKPFGAELVVLDGYRTLACQRALWDFFYTQAVHAAPPGTPSIWRKMAARHAADPRDFKDDDPTT